MPIEKSNKGWQRLAKMAEEYEPSIKQGSHPFAKYANADVGMGMGGGGVGRAPLLYVDPLFDPILLSFPKENLKELNRRLRHYGEYDAVVKNIINLHSTFPYSDMEIKCDDKYLEPYFRDYGDRINIDKVMLQSAYDRELLGESVHAGTWDWDEMEWKEFIHLPPENVDIKQIQVNGNKIFYLKVDDDMRKAASSGKPEDQALFEGCDPEYLSSVREGKPWRLDANCVLHNSNGIEGYKLRGVSPLKAALKWLLAQDKMYLLLLTFCDRTMFPIKLWKIGDRSKDWVPPKKHLDMLQQKLLAIKNDPDADIIYHAFLELEVHNLSSNHEDILKYFEFFQKKITIALNATESMFAEANTYAKDASNIKLIMHRYMAQRAEMNKMIQRQVFLLTSMQRGWLIRDRAEESTGVIKDKSLIPQINRYYVPKILWKPSNLTNSIAQKEYISRLKKEGGSSRKSDS